MAYYKASHPALSQFRNASGTKLKDRMEELALPDPPLAETYKKLLSKKRISKSSKIVPLEVGEEELPLIDLKKLKSQDMYEKEECKRQICDTSKEWGFFQVINHGIEIDIVEEMKEEQVKVFKKPFYEKVNDKELLGGSYQWGTPSATCLEQLSWLEAFHVPLNHIYHSAPPDTLGLRMGRYASAVSMLAMHLGEILSSNIGENGDFIKRTCLTSSCYLRMNRYPPCLLPHETALMSHTDSNFLTILHQDDIGGLQLIKDGKWVAVKPYPGAFIVNIGDLFQAWSNGVYKSVEHRVTTNKWKERLSTAYFLCPSYDTIITTLAQPSIYRTFSFGEYKQQVQYDVKRFGRKIGLSRFLHNSIS